jgi:quinolinate synthase
MLKFARESEADEIIVATEIGILHRMRKENPHKQFYPATTMAVCPNMKRITLDKVASSLETLTPLVTVAPETASRARLAIERMLSIA